MSAICPECSGKGIVEDDDSMDVCPVCDGEGLLERSLQRF